MDRITIENLCVFCIIGTRPEERLRKQKLAIDIALDTDLGAAAMSDNLADTLNYSRLAEEITAFAEGSSFMLLERLAGGVAELCLRDERTATVKVTIGKPAAIPNAERAVIEITRNRKS